MQGSSSVPTEIPLNVSIHPPPGLPLLPQQGFVPAAPLYMYQFTNGQYTLFQRNAVFPSGQSIQQHPGSYMPSPYSPFYGAHPSQVSHAFNQQMIGLMNNHGMKRGCDMTVEETLNECAKKLEIYKMMQDYKESQNLQNERPVTDLTR